MTYTIYHKVGGEIRRVVQVPSLDVLKVQVQSDEDYVEGDLLEYTHVIDGVGCRGVTENTWLQLRCKRSMLLTASDWTQVPDSPLSAEQKQQWAVYRQALRDFPDTCDPVNPLWPTPPA